MGSPPPHPTHTHTHTHTHTRAHRQTRQTDTHTRQEQQQQQRATQRHVEQAGPFILASEWGAQHACAPRGELLPRAPHTRPHTHARAHTHTHTHTDNANKLVLSFRHHNRVRSIRAQPEANSSRCGLESSESPPDCPVPTWPPAWLLARARQRHNTVTCVA